MCITQSLRWQSTLVNSAEGSGFAIQSAQIQFKTGMCRYERFASSANLMEEYYKNVKCFLRYYHHWKRFMLAHISRCNIKCRTESLSLKAAPSTAGLVMTHAATCLILSRLVLQV